MSTEIGYVSGVFIAAAVLLVASVPLLAHHGNASFDEKIIFPLRLMPAGTDLREMICSPTEAAVYKKLVDTRKK